MDEKLLNVCTSCYHCEHGICWRYGLNVKYSQKMLTAWCQKLKKKKKKGDKMAKSKCTVLEQIKFADGDRYAYEVLLSCGHPVLTPRPVKVGYVCPTCGAEVVKK